MSSGERPIGAAKGEQPNTEALCQTPPALVTSASREDYVNSSTENQKPQAATPVTGWGLRS